MRPAIGSLEQHLRAWYMAMEPRNVFSFKDGQRVERWPMMQAFSGLTNPL